jgi:hypothetical protein
MATKWTILPHNYFVEQLHHGDYGHATGQSDIDSNHLYAMFFHFVVGALGESYEASPEGDSCLISVPTHTAQRRRMPLLSLGTAQLITVPGVDRRTFQLYWFCSRGGTYRQTELALSAGVRAFDTAFIYRSPHAPTCVADWWQKVTLSPDKMSGSLPKSITLPALLSILHMPHMADMTPEEVSLETL